MQTAVVKRSFSEEGVTFLAAGFCRILVRTSHRDSQHQYNSEILFSEKLTKDYKPLTFRTAAFCGSRFRVLLTPSPTPRSEARP